MRVGSVLVREGRFRKVAEQSSTGSHADPTISRIAEARLHAGTRNRAARRSCVRRCDTPARRAARPGLMPASRGQSRRPCLLARPTPPPLAPPHARSHPPACTSSPACASSPALAARHYIPPAAPHQRRTSPSPRRTLLAPASAPIADRARSLPRCKCLRSLRSLWLLRSMLPGLNSVLRGVANERRKGVSHRMYSGLGRVASSCADPSQRGSTSSTEWLPIGAQ